MTNQLVTLDDLRALSTQTDAAIEKIATAKKWLPQLRFYTPASKACSQDDFPANHFALEEMNNKRIDLGSEVLVIPLQVRPCAMRHDESGTTVCLDPKMVDGEYTGLFAEIALEAESNPLGATYGAQFLVWLPRVSKFAIFYCGTKTLRNEIDGLMQNIGRCLQFQRRTIPAKGRRPTYTSVGYEETSAPPDNLPEREELAKVVHDFKNPPAPTVLETDDDDNARER